MIVTKQSWEGYELRPGNPVMKGPSEVAAGTTTGKLSFPEFQIKLDDLEDDGTPDVGEVSA